MELIDRKALGVGRCSPFLFTEDGYAEGWNRLFNIINDAPTIDAVPVVRCRECKFYEVDVGLQDGVLCLKHGHKWTVPNPDDFCSYGQRKEAKE
jgi:hypothetical protein